MKEQKKGFPIATIDLEAWIVSLMAWRKSLEATDQVGRKHYLNCVSDAESEVIGGMDRAGLDAVQIPAIIATIVKGADGRRLVVVTDRPVG